jgi:hypothetical protein
MRNESDIGIVKLSNISISELSLALFRKARIRVLVVLDDGIKYGDSDGFGVGRLVRLLRETTLGCTEFSVDIASRSAQAFADNGSGGAGHLRYPGFRFDREIAGEKILHRYDEAFLFGFQPGNNEDGTDADITVISASERAVMLAWMNAGHGVFATGDHHYLGANLCSGVPRVRSMRRWTLADGVPPIRGITRLDTNQPDTPAEIAGTAVIVNSAEGDGTPQPIAWVPAVKYRIGLFEYRRPHEILCHPKHGPIDVMPDHPHEGMCFTPAEISGNATRAADFPGTELPRIIARGWVVPDPPTMHAKGEVNAQTIQMISAYDGWKASVGRVVVDSTWHHWFNLNLVELEAAGGENWEKISRYFVNVAKWLAPKGLYRARCWWEIFHAHFDYPGIEEFHSRATVLEVGEALRAALVKIHGPCEVRRLIFDSISDVAPSLYKGLIERFELPRPDPCLTCPPIDLIERIVLGGLVQGTAPLAERVRVTLTAGKSLEISTAEVERAALEGVAAALTRFSSEVLSSARSVEMLFASFLEERKAG